MYRQVEFESEECATKKLNYLVKYRHSLFQTLIMDDDDECYIPNFDFMHEICDCKIIHNLIERMTWDKFFEVDKPIIFTNTTYLFK